MLHIFHTNDLHGHLEHWPVISQFIKQQRSYYEARGDTVLLVDIGDAMDAQHPLVEASHGQVMVELFNDLAYDMVTIGNNEGLNFSPDQLAANYSQASYDIVLANLLDGQQKELVSWAHRVNYLDLPEGKLAFIGLTAPYQSYQLNGYQVLDPIECLTKILASMDLSKVDKLIILSHLGLDVDRELANRFPEIDLIIGAHTHHSLVQGEWIGQTLLAAAGKYGHYVGHVQMEGKSQQLDQAIQAELYPINYMSELTGLPIGKVRYDIVGRELLRQQVICNLPAPLYCQQLTGPQSFIQHGLDAICQAVDYDLAMLNSGLFLRDLRRGLISKNHLHEALPHPMHLMTLDIRGDYLLSLLASIQAQAADLRFQQINGHGFRGKLFGELVYRGLSYEDHSQQWLIRGQAIKLEENYQLVTVDHLAFVPFFPEITDYGNPRIIFPDFLRQIVGDYLAQTYPLGH